MGCCGPRSGGQVFVEAGPGVSITGAGTAANPWIFSATGSSTPRPIRTATTSQTVGLPPTEGVVLFNGASLTASLPAPAGASGEPITIKNINASALTVDTVGAPLLDNAASTVLAQYESIDVVTDGTNWWVI